jgi:hypothetical protein
MTGLAHLSLEDEVFAVENLHPFRKTTLFGEIGDAM